MEKTDLRRLANRMEELRGASTSPKSDAEAESPRAAASRSLASGSEEPPRHGSAFAFCRLVLETVLLPWSQLARRAWREVVDHDVPGLAAQLSYYSSRCFRPSCFCLRWSADREAHDGGTIDRAGQDHRHLGQDESRVGPRQEDRCPSKRGGAMALPIAAVLVAKRRNYS
jgi:hypothetical protein